MIICNQCGNSLAEGHSFCTECGTVVPVSSVPASAPAVPPPAPASFAPTQRLTSPYRQESQPLTVSAQSGPNPTPWIITSVVILLAAAVIIYQNSKPDTTSSATGYHSNSSTGYNSGRVDYGSVNVSRTPSATPRASNMNMRPAVPNSNPASSSPSQNWTLAYCNANSLNVRSAPVLDTSKSNQVGELKRGDQVYIISESSNYDVYNGVTSNWAEIRTVNGALHGWVFRYYLAAVDETGD